MDEIWLYVASESSGLEVADRVIDSITAQFYQLFQHPHMGRRRDDLRPGLRSLAVGSYVVIYRLEEDDIRILHVLHGRRDIERILRQ